MDNIIVNQKQYNSENEKIYLNTTNHGLFDILPATRYTLNLIIAKPELFKEKAMTFYYAMLTGRKYNKLYFTNIFKQYLTSTTKRNVFLRDGTLDHNSNLSSLQLQYDNHILISFARFMCKYKTIPIFEPSMQKLNDVLDKWFVTKTIKFNDLIYHLTDFEELFYNSDGEKIYTLFPYICYINTFFTFCFPFTFDSEFSSTSCKKFHAELESHFIKIYSQFGKDYGIDIIKSTIPSLNVIPTERFRNMINQLLDFDTIIGIRNKTFNIEYGLLDDVIDDQRKLKVVEIQDGWNRMLSEMFQILTNNNAYSKLLSLCPKISIDENDVHKQMMLTEYAICGGDKPFYVDENSFDIVGSFYDDHSGFDLLKNNGIRQIFKTNIKKCNLCTKPFVASDLMTMLCISYINNEYQKKILDMESSDFLPKLSFDRLFNGFEVMTDLFVSGLWLNHEIEYKKLFSELNEIQKDDINKILNLPKLLNTIYKNNIMANLASLFIIHIIPKILKTKLLKIKSSTFNLNIHSYLNFFKDDLWLSFDEEETKTFLQNMYQYYLGLLCLMNTKYTNFVNNAVESFKLIIKNSTVVFPYIIGLDDDAVKYSIGGIELYSYAKMSNPFIRSYKFIETVYGTDEKFINVMKILKKLNNNSISDLIVKNKYSESYIKQTLLTSLKIKDQLLDVKLDDKISVLGFILKYVFQQSDVSKSIQKIGITKIININNYNLKINPLSTDIIISDGGFEELIPVYDFNGKICLNRITMTSMSDLLSKNKISLTLIGQTRMENNVAWIFTDQLSYDRFGLMHF